MFETPGVAWHASARLLPGRKRRFDVVALDDLGRRLPPSKLVMPKGFLAAHPCTRLLGTSLQLSDEWTGRLFVLRPGMGVHREQSARFALNLAHRIAPAVYDHYLVRRLRTRAQSLERGRIARELHDGVTQSLLGLEMEVVVMRRRAAAEAPRFVDDLARVHRIVRDEVVTVRELMEGIRVGDVESGELLHHLGEVVDRFSRHTGIVARFASDGQTAALTPYVRRHVAGILHEALVNVRKHSGADHVMVRTDLDGARWRLSIEDDGRGFTFAGRRSQEELEALRQGPRTIGERVRLIGGAMTVESRPGFGARIEVEVPLLATG
jgi:two-component system nitrate/nitrite sensor histidine kinase NarX